MNSYRFYSIFTSKALQNLFFLGFLIVVSLSPALAQPSSFTISGCSVTGADGNYTQDVANPRSGCPCYDNASGGVIISSSGADFVYSSTGTCATIGMYLAVNTIYGPATTPCDISTSTASMGFSPGCDPATTLSVYTAPVATNQVPTLSEWGLIILALLFMTLGTLALLQPKVQWKK